jgi:hypothetical protein
VNCPLIEVLFWYMAVCRMLDRRRVICRYSVAKKLKINTSASAISKNENIRKIRRDQLKI